MPNWKKVIVSGSNAVLNNITASGAISASGELYAGLSSWAAIGGGSNQVVVWNDATGELMYTGSYGAGGIEGVIIKEDGTVIGSDITTLDFLNSIVTESPTGESNITFDLQGVTDSGEVTTNGSFFLHQQNASYGFSNQLAKSGFDIDSGNAYSYVTPQSNNYNAHLLTMPQTTNGVGPHPYNYVTMNKELTFIGSNGPITTGGGGDDPTDPDNDHDSDLGGLFVVGGKGINLIASNSLESPDNDRYRGLGIYPSALYFFNKEASGSVSGGLQPASASAKIKFDTGSNAVKFFAGSTDEELKEVMHISKSGDNPRIGIGVTNPLKAFDFKEVSDTNRGGELLIRGSRTTKGAEVGDEAGRINFIIDSSSYAKVETSGSVAEVIAFVDEADASGVRGSLSFRVSAQKTEDSIEKIRITPDRTQVTGSFVVSGSNSFTNIGPATFSGSVDITSSLEVDGTSTFNGAATHHNDVNIYSGGQLNVNSTSGAKIMGAGLSVGSLIVPASGQLRVQDYGMFLGGVHVGGTDDPGIDNLLVDGTTTLVGDTIISGSDLFFPNLTAGAAGNYDKLLIIDSSGQARTLAKSSVPYIEVFDGVTPTNQTLVMFSGSTGDIANATGVSYNSATGWNFSGVGSAYDITVDDIIILNDLTAVGDISATNGSFSGDLTVDGNITANQYIVSSSVTYLTQSFSSGSTIFGDTQDDTHQFTGSLYITGAVNIGSPHNDNYINFESNATNYLGTQVRINNYNTGISLTGNDEVHLIGNNIGVLGVKGVATPQVRLKSNTVFGFTSANINSSVGVNFNRLDSTTIRLGTGGTANANGNLSLTNITASGDISASGALISSELTASGLNYPNTDGDDGQVLLTDGNGKLTFGDVKVYAQVKNISGVTLAKGTPVHATASASPPSGNVSEVIAASASLASSMPATFILDEELADEAEGRAILSGFINGVDTSAFKEGDVVYVGENGGYTTTKPTGTNLIQNLGIITKVDASNGSGYIYGSGRSNDVPNITEGYAWVGNSSGVATATSTSSFVVTTANTASYVAGSNVDGTVASATISTTAINATNAANVDINNVSGNTEYGLIFRDGNGDGNQALYADNEVDQPSYNPSTNTIKTPIISASSALYVSGNITVEEGDITSNTFETISTTLASDSATNVDTFASSAYNGAIYDYILKDTGVGARAGQFMVAHDSGLITFTDNSTKHLSDATAPEISAQINGANVEVQVTNGNGYTFKSFVKKL